MFKALRITILLIILLGVSVSTWLSAIRSTDWNNTLYIKIYPINADGSEASRDYMAGLDAEDFAPIEGFMRRELERYERDLDVPVRVNLGQPIDEQPPQVGDPGNILKVMLWSLKMRWWASSVAGPQDDPKPDVRMFVRYHAPDDLVVLDNSVGLRKGMIGIVNARASRRHTGSNNVIIAHEFMHTLGATDKYDPANGRPLNPEGLAEPSLQPLYPQRYAEIMGGRIALAPDDAMMPKSLKSALIGPKTAGEIGLRN
jgi:hypothetical protein